MAANNIQSDGSNGLTVSDSPIRWSLNGSRHLRSRNSVTIATEMNPRIIHGQGFDIAWLETLKLRFRPPF